MPFFKVKFSISNLLGLIIIIRYGHTSCIIHNRNATLLLRRTDKLISCETRQLPAGLLVSMCNTRGPGSAGAPTAGREIRFMKSPPAKTRKHARPRKTPIYNCGFRRRFPIDVLHPIITRFARGPTMKILARPARSRIAVLFSGISKCESPRIRKRKTPIDTLSTRRTL